MQYGVRHDVRRSKAPSNRQNFWAWSEDAAVRQRRFGHVGWSRDQASHFLSASRNIHKVKLLATAKVKAMHVDRHSCLHSLTARWTGDSCCALRFLTCELVRWQMKRSCLAGSFSMKTWRMLSAPFSPFGLTSSKPLLSCSSRRTPHGLAPPTLAFDRAVVRSVVRRKG